MRSKIEVTIIARPYNYLIVFGSSYFIRIKGTQSATRSDLDNMTAVE